MAKYRLLDLFSGIGGFSLGLERSSYFETVAFCEVEPFCRRVLAKHWPKVPCYDDIRTLTAGRLKADGIAVDAICGGFPCQDISNAGKQVGISGERSGLWSEYGRLIGELRPGVVIVENVAALLGRGLDVVLGDLAAIGFDAEWHCIPASAVGAPHIRDRIWIIAYPQHTHADESGSYRAGIGQCRNIEPANQQIRISRSLGEILAHTTSERRGEARQHSKRHSERSAECGEILAHDDQERFENIQGCSQDEGLHGNGTAVGDSGGSRTSHDWSIEPDVGRVAHGIPARVDRLRSLGNAVVPQIPEIIGRAIGAMHP